MHWIFHSHSFSDFEKDSVFEGYIIQDYSSFVWKSNQVLSVNLAEDLLTRLGNFFKLLRSWMLILLRLILNFNYHQMMLESAFSCINRTKARSSVLSHWLALIKIHICIQPFDKPNICTWLNSKNCCMIHLWSAAVVFASNSHLLYLA